MKKFVFNMQKILNLREFEEEQARIELGKAVGEETRIKDTLELVAKQRIAAARSADGMDNISALYAVNNYIALLDQRKDMLLEELSKAQLVTEEKREIMKAAMTKVKALEKLKDSRKKEWALENKRKEDKELDDIINSRRFIK